jgi:hypothetical protein
MPFTICRAASKQNKFCGAIVTISMRHIPDLLRRVFWFPALSKPVYDPAMLGGRSSEQWIAQYASSHQHPVNRACHTLGIPLILFSVVLFLVSIFIQHLWPYALASFVLGWIFQFLGHAFEHKAPEFFHDWRFLLVGVRWWWAKIHGKA